MRVDSQIVVDAWGINARVKRCVVTEALMRMTKVEVELECDDANLDLNAALWQPACLRFTDQDGALVRAFHGAIERATYLGERAQRFRYALTLQPALFRLGHRFTSRIFQEQSVVDIVTRVLKDAGVDANLVRWDLSFDYQPREYCVQYRETDLNFVTRLLEDEGIFYWFEHDELGETLCFGDGAQAFGPIEGDAALSFRESAAAGEQTVTRLQLSTRMVHGGYRARDWNWQSPAQPVEGEQQDDNGTALLHYEYPAGATSSVDAARVASDRLQALALRKHVLNGETTCGRLSPGRSFELMDANPGYVNGEYLLLSVQHVFEDTTERAIDGARRNSYVARFEAVPMSVGFRPMRSAVRPVIAGTEVAVITGPAGEEIHVDTHGRVKVHFYWDREQPVDDTASCWMRVQQQNTHGSMLLPRVGWEVAVGFLHGDPDQPIVLHKMYNAMSAPPYELPGNLSQAALETHSTGGAGGVSGIRMQDTSGAQGFFVTAHRDLIWTAGHDATETISVDATASIGGNRNTQVGDTETIQIGGSRKVAIKGTATFDTSGTRQIQIGGRDQLKAAHNAAITCDGDRNETIGSAMVAVANSIDESFNATSTRTIGGALVLTTPSGSLIEAVGGAKTETVGAAKVEIVTGDHSQTIGDSLALTAGTASYKAGGAFDLAVAKDLSIEAGSWTETCSKDFGISGKTLLIDAKDGFTGKASGTKLTIKSGKITIDGSGFGAKGGPKLEMKGKIKFKS